MDKKQQRRKHVRGLPQGYRAPAHTEEQLKQFKETSLPRSLAAALGDHILIVACAVGGLLAFYHLPAYCYVPANLFALTLITIRQRGLENLVHEASHYNWDRNNLTLNDRLGNLFAALPVFSTVGNFRIPHRPHHASFGSEVDRDKARYRALDIDNLNHRRPSTLKFLGGMAARLGPYARSWWENIQTSKVIVAKALGWHVVYLLMLGAATGAIIGAWGWLAVRLVPVWVFYWLMPMTVLLTPLRFVAEADKHRYAGAGSVFEATFTNRGRFSRLLHPHNDGYHLTHHLFPSIPHHQLRRAHRYLLCADPEAYGALNSYRDAIFQEPQTSLEFITPVQVAKPSVTTPEARATPEGASAHSSCEEVTRAVSSEGRVIRSEKPHI